MLFSLQKEHTYIITLKVKFILSTNDDKNAAVPLLLIMVVVMTMIMMMMRTIMGDGLMVVVMVMVAYIMALMFGVWYLDNEYFGARTPLPHV